MSRKPAPRHRSATRAAAPARPQVLMRAGAGTSSPRRSDRGSAGERADVGYGVAPRGDPQFKSAGLAVRTHLDHLPLFDCRQVDLAVHADRVQVRSAFDDDRGAGRYRSAVGKREPDQGVALPPRVETNNLAGAGKRRDAQYVSAESSRPSAPSGDRPRSGFRCTAAHRSASVGRLPKCGRLRCSPAARAPRRCRPCRPARSSARWAA